MITIGIDPGLTGGIAFLRDNDARVYDLPVIRDMSLSWIDGSALQSLLITECVGNGARCYVERLAGMPGQSSSAMFNFGTGYGSVLSIIQASCIPLEFVTPAKWKRDLGLTKDKNSSLHKARLLFPSCELHLAKHDGRAEALLIAHWARTRSERAAA